MITYHLLRDTGHLMEFVTMMTGDISILQQASAMLTIIMAQVSQEKLRFRAVRFLLEVTQSARLELDSHSDPKTPALKNSTSVLAVAALGSPRSEVNCDMVVWQVWKPFCSKHFDMHDEIVKLKMHV